MKMASETQISLTGDFLMPLLVVVLCLLSTGGHDVMARVYFITHLGHW